MRASRTFRDGSACSFRFPDLSGTFGWNGSWDFPTGVSGTAAVVAVHANVALGELLAFSRPQAFLDGQPLPCASLPIGTNLTLTVWSAMGNY